MIVNVVPNLPSLHVYAGPYPICPDLLWDCSAAQAIPEECREWSGTTPRSAETQGPIFLKEVTNSLYLESTLFASYSLERKSLAGLSVCSVCVQTPRVYVHACVCVRVWYRHGYVCNFAVYFSFHLCGSPLFFQVATCSFLIQKGPRSGGSREEWCPDPRAGK